MALLLLNYSGFAQFRVSGKITQGANKIPLGGANISLKELNLPNVSDHNGYFEFINIKRGTYTLEVSFIGFGTESRKIDVVEDVNIEFNLKEVAIMTEGVILPQPGCRFPARRPGRDIQCRTSGRQAYRLPPPEYGARSFVIKALQNITN